MPITSSAPIETDIARIANYQDWLGVFVVRSRTGDIELMLPYRDEFSDSSATSTIDQGVIAALATITSRLVVRSVVGQTQPIQQLRIDHRGRAAIGNQLYAHGRAIGAQIYVDICTSDDHSLVAQAIADVPGLARDAIELPDQSRLVQPIYPV